MKTRDLSVIDEIDRYATYFESAARRLYGTPVQARNWTEPMKAVEAAFDNPWPHSPRWGALDRDAFRPVIEEWLKQNHIIGLAHAAHGYKGWTANVFYAQVEGEDKIQIFGIGTEGGSMPHLRSPWNPLLLQPLAQNVFVHREREGDYRLSLTRMPTVPMVPAGEPEGFDEFLNRHILAGTPYRVRALMDFVVLRDGTPLSSDPADSIVFKSAALARRHALGRYDYLQQQKVLRIINANQKILKSDYAFSGRDLPQSMQWVVEYPYGADMLLAKQSVAFGNAFDSLPVRQPEIRVKSSALLQP